MPVTSPTLSTVSSAQPHTLLQRRFVAATDVIAREVGGEVFALTNDGQVHRLLNPSSQSIWQALVAACEAGVTGQQCCQVLTSRYQVSQDEAARDTAAFLTLLLQRRLAYVVDTELEPRK